MKNILQQILICSLGLMLSCNQTSKDLSPAQKKEMIESATAVVKKVFEASNNMQFEKGLDYYAPDADSYYVSDGQISSLSDLRTAYRQIGPAVEVLHNKITAWNVTIISENTVSFTLPVELKLKLKDLPEYNGKLIWSAIVQKRNDEWVIIQSHESWLNCAEVAAALTPPIEKEL